MVDDWITPEVLRCVSCFSLFTPNLDKQICDECVKEAYRHQPKLYAKITLIGGGTYIQPLITLGNALDAEFDGASAGEKWLIELVEMSDAQYEELPDFAGH